MNYELSEEQRILQKTAQDFLKKECSKQVVRFLYDSVDGYSPELWRKMADLGWMGLLIPEEYGGTSWSFLDMAVLLEEMGYNLCPGPFISTVILGAVPIMLGGTETQKEDFLPKIAGGGLILTMALVEADGGYDPAAINLQARRDGNQWILNGVKLFVPDAHLADFILCTARTGDSTETDEGLTLFVVKADTPGMSVTSLKTITNDRQAEVVFNNVRVSDSDVIGSIGQAWPLIKAALDRAAVARAAEAVGAMRAALDLSVAYAKERVQFGRPIGSYQAIQHFLADMWMDILAARNLVLKAAWKLSVDESADKEVAMAKARVGELGRKTTTVGHRIFGAIGFTMEHDLHLYHRQTVAADLAFGDADYHYENVAVSLGL